MVDAVCFTVRGVVALACVVDAALAKEPADSATSLTVGVSALVPGGGGLVHAQESIRTVWDKFFHFIQYWVRMIRVGLLPPLADDAPNIERWRRIVLKYGSDVQLENLDHIPEEIRNDNTLKAYLEEANPLNQRLMLDRVKFILGCHQVGINLLILKQR